MESNFPKRVFQDPHPARRGGPGKPDVERPAGMGIEQPDLGQPREPGEPTDSPDRCQRTSKLRRGVMTSRRRLGFAGKTNAGMVAVSWLPGPAMAPTGCGAP